MKFFWSLGCSDKAAVLAGQSVPVRFVDFLETGAGSLGHDGATVEFSAERSTSRIFKSSLETKAKARRNPRLLPRTSSPEFKTS